YPLVLLTMPLFIWLATKHDSRLALVTLALTTVSALTIAVAAGISVSESTFLMTQLSGTIVFGTALFLRASNAERTEAIVALAGERKLLEEKIATRTAALRALAETDALTGLANRRSFEQALKTAHGQSIKGLPPAYLLYIDLDRFKIVNDTSGHAAGDALLKQISNILRARARDTDTVGRLGGDEFALLLYGRLESEALEIAEFVRADVEGLRFAWDEEVHRIGASIGAVALESSIGGLEELKQLADAACYTAKNTGRNRVHLAQPGDIDLQAHRGEVRWAQRITDAINNNDFVLYGQAILPVVRQPGEPEQIEVLLRLRDREARQFVQPGEFLPAAERYGLATQIDEWVIRNLIKNIYVHNAFDASARQYWVNLSGTSIGDAKFVQFLIDAIKNSPVERGLINFEISETAVIRNVNEVSRLMGILNDMGCKFSLDDFGNGLSSFAHLKRLPVDQLKIDGEFITDIGKEGTDRIFVQSIIDIAHSLGMKAVAEYVENDEILNHIRGMGVDYIQGFGIHSPSPLMPSFKDSIVTKTIFEETSNNTGTG
ncbi:MAG: EAL domain-containing protein, partial [Pseudomonadota bacterium]